MDHEQLKGLLLSVLQTCDEVFARQALLALGHGRCSGTEHPHPQAQVTSQQHDPDGTTTVEEALRRAKDAENNATQYRRRAEQAEHDVTWYRHRLDECEHREWTASNAEADCKGHKERADAYAAWLARHHSHLKETADAVWTLLFQYDEGDRVIPKTDT
jgi:hypothetical protein